MQFVNEIFVSYSVERFFDVEEKSRRLFFVVDKVAQLVCEFD